jgi:hypothetical protein
VQVIAWGGLHGPRQVFRPFSLVRLAFMEPEVVMTPVATFVCCI